MDDVDRGEVGTPVPTRAGDVLRAAREAQGLSLADIAGRTRVPQRHLQAIESSEYTGLPSITYAVGFAKAYARAVGADEVAIAADVRREVALTDRRAPRYEPYVAPDPSRVPSRAVAIIGAGVALAILVLIGLWYASDLFRPGVTNVSVPAEPTGAAVVQPIAPAPSPALSPTGQVTLAATDEVWLRVYDADNKTLFLGTMKPGDRFDVPADAKDPMINVGRPDKLDVTVNGSKVAPLGTGDRAIKDVKVGAAALAARSAAMPAAIPTSSADTSVVPAPTTIPPTETRPAETRPAETRPAETRPVETRPAETRSIAAPRSSTSTPGRSRTATPTPRRTTERAPTPRPSPAGDKPENLLPKGFSTNAP